MEAGGRRGRKDRRKWEEREGGREERKKVKCNYNNFLLGIHCDDITIGPRAHKNGRLE